VSDQSLAEYIDGLLRQGYQEAQIRQALAQRGYPQSMIDASFAALQSGAATGQATGLGTGGRPQPSVREQLAAYLRTYLAQGYQAEQLRPFLLQQGYPKRDVDAALAATTGQHVVRHEVHLPMATILKVFLVLLVLGGAFYGFSHLFGGNGAPSSGNGGTKLLDVTLTLDSVSAKPGDKVRAEASATNLGSASKYDVTLEYQLLDEYGSVAWSEEKTKAIATSMTDSQSVPIPVEASGKYTVKVIATYGGSSPATASQQLSIQALGSSGTTVNKTGNDENGTPTESTLTEIIVVSGEDQESVTDQAIAAARTGDSTKAEAICKGIENQARRDSCLGTIVLTDKKASHCDEISGVEERETCLMPFIMEGDYSLCPKLVTQERKDLCANLKHLSGLQSMPTEQPDINDFAQPTG